MGHSQWLDATLALGGTTLISGSTTPPTNGAPLVEEKYGWPVAETIGAVAALYERTGNARYHDWYDRLWEYAETALITPSGYRRAPRGTSEWPVKMATLAAKSSEPTEESRRPWRANSRRSD
jgi:mannose/cellobiose epimerase-like protein (N-acyl-D-glucosamine 2-epimerase family)